MSSAGAAHFFSRNGLWLVAGGWWLVAGKAGRIRGNFVLGEAVFWIFVKTNPHDSGGGWGELETL